MIKKNVCKVCGNDRNIVWHWVAHSPDTFTPMCIKHHKEEHRKDPSLDVKFPDWKQTTVTLRMGTKIRIQKEGRFEEIWDTLLNRIMDEFDEYQEVKKSWQGQVLSR